MVRLKMFAIVGYLMIAVLVGISLAAGCSTGEQPSDSSDNDAAAYSMSQQYVTALLWSQTAAEARALCYQAFNLSEMRLDEALQSHDGDDRLAVVVDIDETVVDNSACYAEWVESGGQMVTYWLEWVELAESEPLPGAKDFLDHAASQGVDVFYVTNRPEGQREATVENLVSVGFPFADNDHLYMRQAEASKESRRQAIAEEYEIVLLLGDNLNDFSDVFEDKLVPDRFAAVDSLRDEFGTRFIVLPNPVYGDWEDAVCDYASGLSEDEEASLRMDALEGYK